LIAAVVCGVLVGVGMITTSHAQTNFTIKANTPEIEAEYQKELDKWMLQAYEGDRDAQFKVGVLFTNEQFRKPDYEQAVYWYKQAARQGHVLAQYNLGHQYLTGVGAKRNETSAMTWWLKAAEQDHSLAQFNVGRAYYLGIGLDKDHDQSRYWFERAAQNNEPKSIDILEQLGWAEPGKYKRPSQAEPPSENKNVASSAEATPGPDSQAQTEPTTDKEETETAAKKPLNKNGEITGQPIAIYTNPAVRSVLIAILDIRDQLSVVSKTDEWTLVTADAGFPVWVHENFIAVADDIGTVTGTGVNARSVPLITNGTVVGKLQKGEMVAVLDQRDKWFRVKSPKRFKAWVKTAEYERTDFESPSPDQETVKEETINKTVEEPQPASSTVQTDQPGDDNEWLFEQPSDHYTLQLASFDDQAKVTQFLLRKEFKNNSDLRRFTSNGKGIEWTYFLYGSYAGKSEAESSRDDIGQKRAWVRSFGKLQQNRCVAWKKQIPTPRSLNQYCIQ